MEMIRKRYIVDEKNRRMAVQIPIEVFERVEEGLQNYGLVQLMKETEGSEILGVNEGKAYYDSLGKALHRKGIYRHFP